MRRSPLSSNVLFPMLALLWTALCAVPGGALAAGVGGASCEALPSRVLPDPVACQGAAGLRLAAEANADQRAQALVALAKTRLQTEDRDGAGQALDCAESVIAGQGDAASRYALVRTRARLAYDRDRMPEAKAHLECALAIAIAREDHAAIAGDTNAIGSTLRRVGDLSGAMKAFTRSIEMQRAQGKVGGAVLNNLGDLYREEGDHDEALRHYREARKIFLDDGNQRHAAHALESMAVVEMSRGRIRESARWLDEALQIYREHGPRDYELRTTGRLIQAALAQGDIATAERWKASGLAVAASHAQPLPAVFQLQVARLDRLTGDPSAAMARLRGGLADLGEEDPDRVELLEELAAAQEALGDRAAALDSLRRAHAQADALAKDRYDRELGWLRTMFETAERDRTIARLENDNQMRTAALRQRTLWLWLTVAIAIVLMLGGWLLLLRRRQRERLVEAARLARKEEALARYRREAGALAEDRQLLQALLDSRDDAVCLLDAEGAVLAANRAACLAFDVDHADVVGASMADRLSAADGDALRTALERMEDVADQQIELSLADARRWRARLSQWPQGDGLIVCTLSVVPGEEPGMSPVVAPVAARERVDGDVSGGRDALASTADVMPPVAHHAFQDHAFQERAFQDRGDAASAHASRQDPKLREDFRRALVELMLSSLEAWERATGTGRLELAEKSRIWRVAVDDGRVRARAMERYLGVSRLPQNPRWRDVVRTGYYVLEHCAMESDARDRLQHQVDAVLAYTRRSALV